jgi:hypothetical protein
MIVGRRQPSIVFDAPDAKHAPIFKRGAAGNHLDLWAKATKQSICEAALDLCARLGKETPRLSVATEKRNP